MKNYFIAIIALVAFSFSTNAQDIRLGAKGGFNFANFIGDDTDDAEVRTSFFVGGLAEFKFSEKFAFQPEILYSSQGSEGDFGGNDNIKAKLGYINFPLMAKFFVADGFSLEAGPQVGVLVSKEWEAEGDGASLEVDPDDFYKDLDFGLNFGVSYEFTSGLFLTGRYNLGLSNIVDDGDDLNIEQKNGVWQVGAGFFF
ncbi:porin family protein [Galbibacter mesophilus]|uniref:porin family protein n=1 Tax=Galbibacter mesophilus TaxID=379069 RepID=UPI00191F4A0C|nr:porin family protein [Galbibacter mesophilus]MCM5664423.1 PorT family protein [Galbibacter mesophilus]